MKREDFWLEMKDGATASFSRSEVDKGDDMVIAHRFSMEYAAIGQHGDIYIAAKKSEWRKVRELNELADNMSEAELCWKQEWEYERAMSERDD